jgi:3-isopropylmalate dehydratase large subunit
LGWATGYVYFTLARQRRVMFAGALNPWVGGKDIVLELLRRWGASQAQGMSVEFVDAGRQLPMVARNTIANMMAEAEALNGIFAPDDLTRAWYRARGIEHLPYPDVSPGADAVYAIDETFDLSAVAPMIARPFSPGNAFPADDIARERITFDKA